MMASIGQVWDRTVEFLGEQLPRLMPVIALAMFVPACISAILEPMRATSGFGVRLGLSLLSLVIAIVSLWAQLVIVSRAIDPSLGRQAKQVAASRLPAAIGLFLIVIVAFVAMFLPIAFLFVLAGIDTTTAQAGTGPMFSNMTPTIGWAIVAYSIVYLAIALLIAARMMPLIGVVAAERRGFGAFARAFALTRGMTWKLIGVFILYVVVTVVAVMAVRTVIDSVAKLALGAGAATVVTTIAVAVVSTALTVLAAVFYGKLYAVLSERERLGSVAAS